MLKIMLAGNLPKPSLGMTMKSTLGAADPRRPAHLDDFTER